jgi:hypothetical protein
MTMTGMSAVFQGMFHDHASLSQAFRPGCPDMVLMKDLQHAGTRPGAPFRHAANREANNRHDDLLGVQPEI